jgi:Phosphoenolpyruvate carboxykinase C-terminal P-loop domain
MLSRRTASAGQVAGAQAGRAGCFGENSWVLKWIVERLNRKADAAKIPIGHVPTKAALDTSDLDMDAELNALLTVELGGVEAGGRPDAAVLREVRRAPAHGAVGRVQRGGLPVRLTGRSMS